MNKDSAASFAELVSNPAIKSCDGELFNITFFMGSGFSKAWDKNYPLGKNLFSISAEVLDRDYNKGARLESLCSFLESHGYDMNQQIDSSRFKDIVFQLLMQLKYPDIRTRYMDEGNIRLALMSPSTC